MKKLIYLFIFIFTIKTLVAEEYISGKVISLISQTNINNTSNENNEGIEKISRFKIKLLDGENKGDEIEVDFPTYIGKQYNLSVKPGDKVVLYRSYDINVVNTENIENQEEKIESINIADIDKRNIFYFLSIIFFSLTIFIAKKNGLKSILALLLTLIFIVIIFIPLIAKGYSPIFWAVITCIFSTIITIGLIMSYSKKSCIAILGTISGVIVAGIISHIFSNIMRLTGYADADILSYATIVANINLKELISAGVIIGSLGAVMDVSVSIASSINEIYENNPEITEKNLFKSAMNIGNDIIGTMINTLVFAYVGSSLLTILLIYIQSSEYPLIRVLNYEDIAIEILRAICGSLGILIAVPFTSYIGVKFYKKINKE